MKIEINLKIILLIILFILLNRIDTYLIFIVFIVIHELSHMMCGMLLGFVPKTLRVNPLGVSIEFYNYNEFDKEKRNKRIITYLAGPIVNLILAVITYFLKIELSLKYKIIYTNLLLSIFNLIPILPLDGGKALKEILRKKYNDKVTTIFMLYNTKIILALFTIGYSIVILRMKNIAIVFLILYLWYLYFIEEKKGKLKIRIYEAIEREKQ